MLAPVDIIILLLVATAFIAVCIRIKRKGACADCSEAGSCSHAKPGACSGCPSSRTGVCPACKGVDAVADELGKGVGGKRCP